MKLSRIRVRVGRLTAPVGQRTPLLSGAHMVRNGMSTGPSRCSTWTSWSSPWAGSGHFGQNKRDTSAAAGLSPPLKDLEHAPRVVVAGKLRTQPPS